MADHTSIADARSTARKLALQGLRRPGADDPLFAPAAAADAPPGASGQILGGRIPGDLILADSNLADAGLGPRADGAPRARDGSDGNNGSGAKGREAQ
jgi:hypothetical protein